MFFFHETKNVKIKKRQKEIFTSLLLVNFGGPRSLAEVRPFLFSLLNDKEIIRTPFPQPLHSLIFSLVSELRAVKLRRKYAVIGGKSPLYFETQALVQKLLERLSLPCLCFHRYLEETHLPVFQKIEESSEGKFLVFPLFPHFSFATTGSISALFSKKLSASALKKLIWIPSYSIHDSFISLWKKRIASFLKRYAFEERKTALLFTAHGLPCRFIKEGDSYEQEIRASFNALSALFPEATCSLGYQSRFGFGKWLSPSTKFLTQTASEWAKGKENLLFIPLSFTSDQIETLYEIEKEYLPIARAQGFFSHRLPCFGSDDDWVETIIEILRPTLCINP